MSGKVVDPQARSAESVKKLLANYEGVYAQRVPDRVDAEEREARKDPLYAAHKTVEDVVRMFNVLADGAGLGAAERVYVVELFALNVLRSRDCPLAAAQVEKVRAKALAYYEAGLAKLP